MKTHLSTSTHRVDNFICIDRRKKNCIIVLNTYKTSNIYSKTVRTFSPELCSIIVNYIERNRLADYLFYQEVEFGLGKFITDMNKKINIDQGINYIRHSKISEFLHKLDITPEMRSQFSVDCMHSESINRNTVEGYLTRT